MTSLLTWPDTSSAEPPRDHLYASATWLLGRHQMLAELIARVPDVLELDPEGLGIDLDALAAAIVDHDAGVIAWEEYERTHRAPDDEARFIAWQDAGPQLTPGAEALAKMSTTERTRLRLLAAFSSTRVPLKAGDLQHLDDAGQRLLADWCQALQAA